MFFSEFNKQVQIYSIFSQKHSYGVLNFNFFLGLMLIIFEYFGVYADLCGCFSFTYFYSH